MLLRDFQVEVGAAAKYGIYGTGLGDGLVVVETNGHDASFHGGGISNVMVKGGNANYALIRLVNPFYAEFSSIRAWTNVAGCIPMIVEGNSSAMNYGNCEFKQLFLSGTTCTAILLLNETAPANGHVFNLNTFTDVTLEMFSASSGQAGLYLSNQVSYNSFNLIDSEGADIAVKIDSAGDGYEPYANTFTGGYFAGLSVGIYCGEYSGGSNFHGGLVEGSTYQIQDLTPAWYQPNTFSDLTLTGAGTVSSNGYSQFRGTAGQVVFFDCYTPFTNIANGTAVAVGGAGTWGLVGTPTVALVTLQSQGYAWTIPGASTMNSTYVKVYFAGNTTNTVSGTLYAAYNP